MQPVRTQHGGGGGGSQGGVIVVNIPNNNEEDAVALVRDAYIIQGQQLMRRLYSFTHQGNQEKFENVSCPVCLENYKLGEKVVTLPCFHKFHQGCITSWIEEKGFDSVCPVCKQNVKELLDSSNVAGE
eukprot:TRINITY_DN30252_c0_g1_i12.p11 TRINITY_DN30252_c0_g1~~TRINITY_DN30252_c0_g1_i12.p11  ORF type:complete len:128 (+),score=20.69 TRINITY_DN30252_c0_g1_i12:2188-2571(+)